MSTERRGWRAARLRLTMQAMAALPTWAVTSGRWARGLVPALVVLTAVPLGSWRWLPSVQAQPVACDVPDVDRPLDDAEAHMLELINGYRAEQGLPVLTVVPALQRSARWKAAALAAGGVHELTTADHDDLDRTWDQRIIDCGYPAAADFGENLGGSTEPEAELLEAWKRSPTHDANLRDPRWRAIGLTRVALDGGFSYWVTEFGSDAGEDSAAP